jgi:hypothetical protein
MAKTDTSSKKTSPSIEVGPNDILFECPACDKSLVVDQSAEGLTVACPQCHTNLIVPPKSQPPSHKPAPKSALETLPNIKTEKPASKYPEPTPQPTPVVAEVSSKPAPTPAADSPTGPSDVKGQQDKMGALTGKLKELQTQRTELNNRIAARLNEVNRDLVLLARLETSQQQVISELNQLAATLATAAETTRTSEKTAGAGAAATGRSRVTFQV